MSKSKGDAVLVIVVCVLIPLIPLFFLIVWTGEWIMDWMDE